MKSNLENFATRSKLAEEAFQTKLDGVSGRSASVSLPGQSNLTPMRQRPLGEQAQFPALSPLPELRTNRFIGQELTLLGGNSEIKQAHNSLLVGRKSSYDEN